jgi:aminoglycoside 2'-N-acetyltransferase I
VKVAPVSTAALDVTALRALLDLAYGGDITDHDLEHALGGAHVVAHEGALLVGHVALVERTLWLGVEPRRVGYVEALAVHPAHQRRGLGDALMEAIEAQLPRFEFLALSTSEAGRRLYERRGWRQWRGPTFAALATGRERTPDDDGGVYVFARQPLDLDAALTCDERLGDAW